MLLQVHAFVAPKIIGGKNAPSPVGELGMVEMSQALELIDVNYEQVRNISDIVLKISFQLLSSVKLFNQIHPLDCKDPFLSCLGTMLLQ